MTHVRGSTLRTERKTVIGDKEFEGMLESANHVEDKFLRLRSLALLCLLRLTGKRRTEMAILELSSLKVEDHMLNVTFNLLKKKRRFKKCPACEEKNTTRSKFCKKCGFNLENVKPKHTGNPDTSTKSIPLTDPLTKPIFEYLDLLNSLHPKPIYLFPSTRQLWGKVYIILPEKHLKGRQIFNLVRACSEAAWPHLFRETVASDVVKSDPSMIGAFRVQRRLDLESFETGFTYVKRYASDIIQRELKEIVNH
jgi:integrase